MQVWQRCTIFFFVLLISTIGLSQEQKWVEMMEDPSANFYEIQSNFNEYWDGREIKRGVGWKQFKRWEYFMEQRAWPNGRIPAPNATAEAMAKYYAEYPPASDKTTTADWQPLGPYSWNTVSYNPGIGRINATAVDPLNPDIIYVGAPSGGLWISNDGGGSWVTTTDDQVVLGVSSIAIDPQNTSTIYIASGDGDAGDTYSVGVLKSEDGGTTFSTTGLNWTITQTRRISKLLIDPTNSDVLIAATSSGIYRSLDAAANWSLIQSGNFKDIEFKPGDPQTIYAAGTTFYRSTNGGASFTRVTSGVPTSVSRFAIAVTPANPDYVYMLAGSFGQDLLGVYRSDDSGASFSVQATTPNILGYAIDGSEAGGQAWYDLAIAASPDNAEEIFTGGVNIWHSIDGGRTFTISSHWFLGPNVVPYVHADIHSLDFHGDILFAGTDGGVWNTADKGLTWTDISFGLATTQFYRIGGYPDDASLVIGGTQDNGTNLLNGDQWTHVLGADGMEASIDHSNPDIMYACIQVGGLRKSVNGGNSFTNIRPGGAGSGGWVTPHVMDPNNAEVIYAGYQNLWQSENGGNSWRSLGGVGSTIRSIALTKANSDYIYMASYGSIRRSTDGGVSWTDITSGLPTGSAALTYIAVSSLNPDRVWVTFSGFVSGQKVYRSTDGGSSWTNISSGLPNLPVNCVVVDRGSDEGVYVGTDVGIYYRNNASSEWRNYSEGLPNVIVQELEIHDATRTLKAATYGRGLWESPLEALGPTIVHTPLITNEDPLGPYSVVADILPGDNALIDDSVAVTYAYDGGEAVTLPMTSSGRVGDWEADIPGPGSAALISYYISAQDESGLTVTLPIGAPATQFEFSVGPDTVLPVVVHEPAAFYNELESGIELAVEASDDFGTDSAWVEYTLNGENLQSFTLQATDSNYVGTLALSDDDTNIGDEISYEVFVRDASQSMNVGTAGPFLLEVKRIEDVLFAPNLAIPNNDTVGVTNVISIGEVAGLGLADLDIVFRAAHVNIGDLVVRLQNPQGDEITLMNRPGHPASPLGNPGNDPDIVFDDDASESIETITAAANEVVTGSYRPDPDAIADLLNDDGYGGYWSLIVSDEFTGASGTLLEWGLRITYETVPTSIVTEESDVLPQTMLLEQNYPNPFNPSTFIRFQLPESADVQLTIYNVLGQAVRTLLNGTVNAGQHQIEWNGLDNRGQAVGGGIYFYQLSSGDTQQTRKMLLVR